MKSARVAACIVSCVIGMAAQAQNTFDSSREFSTVLTCNEVVGLNKSVPLCKHYASIGNCLAYFSAIELENFQNKCLAVRLKQIERTAIYDNCVISKSRGVNSSAMHSVRSLCRNISQSPTILQRWRWGS